MTERMKKATQIQWLTWGCIKRKYRDGTDSFGIAFNYEDEDGHKKRKVFTERSPEELWEKHSAFLTELYFKKHGMNEFIGDNLTGELRDTHR